jgi:hypothetical protein
LSPSRSLKIRDSQNFDNSSAHYLPKQPSSLKTEDTSEKKTTGADSDCKSKSAHDGLNLEPGSHEEVQIVEEVVRMFNHR